MRPRSADEWTVVVCTILSLALMTWALASTALLAGPKRPPTLAELRETAVRLQFAEGICSGTAVGPDKVQTAAHCLKNDRLVTANGSFVGVMSQRGTGPDTVELTLAGVRFGRWVQRGIPKQGDRVRFFGNPHGEPDLLRVGYISRVGADGIIVDVTICRGDSGSGLLNDAGELVGVVSAMSDANGCTFMVAH